MSAWREMRRRYETTPTGAPRRVPAWGILVAGSILGAAVGAVALLATSASANQVVSGAIAGALVGPLIGAAYLVILTVFVNTPKR